jgi:hypothetical protein
VYFLLQASDHLRGLRLEYNRVIRLGNASSSKTDLPRVQNVSMRGAGHSVIKKNRLSPRIVTSCGCPAIAFMKG